MSTLEEQGPSLNEAIATRSAQIVETLRGVGDDELRAASRLPGWSRLTIACHLRFGAQTIVRMTTDALAGRAASYYPQGRQAQRETTLAPGADETAIDVVDSLGAWSQQLQRTWSPLTAEHWQTTVNEPEGNADLGPLPLVRLALLRLSEVEVHGSDLGLGPELAEWSELFVQRSLPFRLDWLNSRRTNHQGFDAALEGSWLLTASDGPTYLVSVSGPHVESRVADPMTPADAVIRGTSRELLSLLLGRSTAGPEQISGDGAFGRRFTAAFPGP